MIDFILTKINPVLTRISSVDDMWRYLSQCSIPNEPSSTNPDSGLSTCGLAVALGLFPNATSESQVEEESEWPGNPQFQAFFDAATGRHSSHGIHDFIYSTSPFVAHYFGIQVVLYIRPTCIVYIYCDCVSVISTVTVYRLYLL